MSGEPARVTLKGQPIVLAGDQVEVGAHAPDFTALDQDLNEVAFCDFRGRPCILSSVVSLDTPVCDVEARRFNEEAARLSPNLQILVISMDLPFALKRWCGRAGVDRVLTLSDHRRASFGTSYGILIEGMRLLARAVFAVDSKGVITYKEVVSEVTDEPDYDRILAAVREIS